MPRKSHIRFLVSLMNGKLSKPLRYEFDTEPISFRYIARQKKKSFPLQHRHFSAPQAMFSLGQLLPALFHRLSKTAFFPNCLHDPISDASVIDHSALPPDRSHPIREFQSLWIASLITSAGHYHTGAGLFRPLNGKLGKTLFRHRCNNIHKISLQPGQYYLGLRIAKPAVVLDYASGRPRSASNKYQAAFEFPALRIHGSHGGQEYFFYTLPGYLFRIIGIGADGSHAPGIRAFIPVIGPFGGPWMKPWAPSPSRR